MEAKEATLVTAAKEDSPAAARATVDKVEIAATEAKEASLVVDSAAAVVTRAMGDKADNPAAALAAVVVILATVAKVVNRAVALAALVETLGMVVKVANLVVGSAGAVEILDTAREAKVVDWADKGETAATADRVDSPEAGLVEVVGTLDTVKEEIRAPEVGMVASRVVVTTISELLAVSLLGWWVAGLDRTYIV